MNYYIYRSKYPDHPVYSVMHAYAILSIDVENRSDYVCLNIYLQDDLSCNISIKNLYFYPDASRTAQDIEQTLNSIISTVFVNDYNLIHEESPNTGKPAAHKLIIRSSDGEEIPDLPGPRLTPLLTDTQIADMLNGLSW